MATTKTKVIGGELKDTTQKENGLGELAHVPFAEMQQYMRENFPDALPEPDKVAPEEPQRRVVIGTLAYDARMHCAHAFALLQASFAIAREGWELSFVLREGDSMVARGRNVLVAKFMEDPKNTDLLLLDTDLDFPPEDVIRLLKAPVDVVAGCYPYKDDTGQFPLRWPVEGLYETNGLWEVQATTPGFMRITRKALEKMINQLPHLAYTDNALGDGKTSWMLFDNACRQNGVYDEGYIFCEHWHQLGGKVWIDPKCKITHIGQKKYYHGTVVDWLQRTADNVQKLKADFPHIPDLDLVAFCAKREIDYAKFNSKYSDQGEASAAATDAGADSAKPETAKHDSFGERGQGRPVDAGFAGLVAAGLSDQGQREGAGGQPWREVRPGA